MKTNLQTITNHNSQQQPNKRARDARASRARLQKCMLACMPIFVA
jgi:hypothetical protein